MFKLVLSSKKEWKELMSSDFLHPNLVFEENIFPLSQLEALISKESIFGTLM